MSHHFPCLSSCSHDTMREDGRLQALRHIEITAAGIRRVSDLSIGALLLCVKSSTAYVRQPGIQTSNSMRTALSLCLVSEGDKLCD